MDLASVKKLFITYIIVKVLNNSWASQKDNVKVFQIFKEFMLEYGDNYTAFIASK